MAKRLKAGRNGYDPEKVQELVKRFENVEKQIDSLKGEFMAECKGYREDQRAILDEGKDAGIPKKALRAVLKQRALERKVAEVRDALEPDDADSFDAIRHALGDLADLPLGQHALDAVEDGNGQPAAPH